MKSKVACILLIAICITGYNPSVFAVPIAIGENIAQNQYMVSQSKLVIISAISAVEHGGIGVITIQGKPNTLYNIKTSYKLENKIIPVIQWRTTDGTGVTTFNWVVSKKTMAGTYDATISGGGDVLKTYHKVI